MSNLSYCRFQNTLADLRDCYCSLDDKDLSPDEDFACKQLIRLCKKIADDYADDYAEAAQKAVPIRRAK